MAGSDWRRLLERHRKEDLLNVYVSGSRRGKAFSNVDYDSLLGELEAKKQMGKASVAKVDSLVRKNKQNKEGKLLSEHRKAWKRMYTTLNSQLRVCQEELEVWRSQALLDPSLELSGFLKEAYLIGAEFQDKRDLFERELTSGARLLRKEVMGVVKQKRAWSQTGSCVVDDISRHIAATKVEHALVEQSLAGKWVELTNELQLLGNRYINTLTDKSFDGGVPQEVWSGCCPSNGLRQEMADEFEAVDAHFCEQLTLLKKQYTSTIESLHMDWSEEDTIRYDLVLQQYPRNGRGLYIDRLMRDLPGKFRREIVEYESGSCAAQYYKNQKAIILSSWLETHNTLRVKVSEVYNEAIREWTVKKALEMESNYQRNLCNSLSNKVKQWRELCIREQLLEADRAARLAIEQESLRRREEKELARKREKAKTKIQDYNRHKEIEREQEIKRQCHIAEEVKRNTEREVERGRERVMYREHLLETKREEMEAIADMMREREREKEMQLESLRELVRIEAPRDPGRAMKDTASSRAKVTTDDSTLELLHPLFPMTSFTDQKILSDKRFQVSNALREAGLISTHYAQEILSSIPPPQQPRRDQKSSLFK